MVHAKTKGQQNKIYGSLDGTGEAPSNIQPKPPFNYLTFSIYIVFPC